MVRMLILRGSGEDMCNSLNCHIDSLEQSLTETLPRSDLPVGVSVGDCLDYIS